MFLQVIVMLLMLSILIIGVFVKEKLVVLSSYIGILTLVLIQYLLSDYRWQMIPLYLFILIYICTGLLKINLLPKRSFLINKKPLRIIVMAFLGFLFIMVSSLPFLFPVKDLPLPSGDYSVGTRSIVLKDTEREEVFTSDESDYRKLLVTAWYPTGDTSSYERQTYWDQEEEISKAFSKYSGMFEFMYSHLSMSKTNSYIDAPISNDKDSFPVLIYSHSFYGINRENTILFESLASNGYIVFSINHTYESIGSLYPNGSFVIGDLEHFSTLYDSNSDKENELYKDFDSASTEIEKESIVKEIITNNEQYTEMVKIRTSDSIFVLDELDRINLEDEFFASKLDLDKIGMFGWSLGGATTEETCLTDDRIKACVNMDGWPIGEVMNATELIDKPFMYIRAEELEEMDKVVNILMLNKFNSDGYLVNIEDTVHSNFLDFPYYFKAYSYLGFWGSLDPVRMSDINGTLLLNFFDKYINEEDIDLIGVSDEFSETVIRVKD